MASDTTSTPDAGERNSDSLVPRWVSMSNPQESLASQIRNRRTAWTAEELAELLALSRKHIYKLAKKGRMPSLRIGGAIRFDPHSTANWLEGKTITI